MSDKQHEMESAIPPYLTVERTRPLGVNDDFKPSTPSYSARFNESVGTLPMMFLGVQFRKPSVVSDAAIQNIVSAYELENGPSFWDEAFYLDEVGFTNHIFVGYWDCREKFNEWQKSLTPDWWYSALPDNAEIGVFREAYTPRIVDTETSFSHHTLKAIQRLRRA